MKERPIPFSGPMVRAILAGTKTQTRRVVRNPARLDGLMLSGEEPDWCPYGRPGDRLWVRETWALHWYLDDAAPKESIAAGADEFWYQALDGVHDPATALASHHRGKWRSSRFMPREAARLTLEITDVRVQRLQEISDEDALAEGVQEVDGEFPLREERMTLPLHAFAFLWDQTQLRRKNPGGLAWANNPWVWAITFRRAK